MRLGWDPSFENEEDAYRRPYEGEVRDTGFDEALHAGICTFCGDPVAKGCEVISDGDVFHAEDDKGRCVS